MTAYQEAMEACQESKEPTSVEMESLVVHEEVAKEEATVKTVRALKKRYGDWHLATGRFRQLKKPPQGTGGSWKKFVAACRGLTSHTIPAGHKGCQGPGRDSVARGAPKGWMLERR
jgi:hypothetical protein